MRLAVTAHGYRSAARALVSGNRDAADACLRLAGRLQAYAAMAGDDATATEFAAGYDEAAAESVAALGELVAGLASLAHLAEASLANHDRAERDSVVAGLPGWAAEATGPPSVADHAVGVAPAPPPSSLGGDPAVLPEAVNWILDRIEGVVWPDADTGRLREAAAVWHDAAGGVRLVLAACDTALSAFEQEESPEIPLAVATTLDLRERVLTLADRFDVLGDACSAYADQVDAKRQQMLDLLTDLAVELGVGAIVSGVLTLLSGGLAAVAASSAAASRIAWAAHQLQLIVDALRVLTGGTAATVRPVAVAARDARAWFARLHAARLAARSERGSFRLLPEDRRPPGWLTPHEKPPGHTIGEHVDRPDDVLRTRLRDNPKLPNASTFIGRARAERLIDSFLTSRQRDIDAWLTSGRKAERFDGDMATVTGRTAWPDGRVEWVSGIRVVLLRDPTMPEGFHILTAYPRP